MTTPTPTALERAIERHGDDVYRLALLLCPTEQDAVVALHRAVPGLSDTPASALGEPALVTALVAALPPERRRPWPQRLPGWARRASTPAEARLLAAAARLPRQQRLALGLTLLRGFDATQAAEMLGDDAARIRLLVRDALRALAPHLHPAPALEHLATDTAPEECRPTRAALALGDDQAHADQATRGHLALCAACRAAEQTWQQLTTAVENALRGALRDATLPEHLHDDLRAARTPARKRGQLLAHNSVRLALVAVAVLAAIAILVLPRRDTGTTAAGGTAGTAAAVAPRDLAKQALDHLYAPPDGAGVWHGRWEIRWSFSTGSYATLNAEEWIDTATNRHRVQLVHRDGGGPFEFELADAAGNLWYAVAPSYAPSLYLPLFEGERLRIHDTQLAPPDMQRMLQARLDSGAWGLASAYLRQALEARELRSWGRQRVGGTTFEVIGFDGSSPLAPPGDAPDSAAVPTTILLSIDTQSGALSEVRELIGPPGGERATRTTWRFVGGEWLAGQDAIASAFDLRRAWNGTGDFDSYQATSADPALPLDSAGQVMSLAQAAQNNPAFWLPAAAPPGAERAVLLASPDGATSSIVYLGAGRRLAIRTFADADSPELRIRGGERVTINGQPAIIMPTNAQGYQANMTLRGPSDRQAGIRVGASGYTRAELLDVLRGIGLATSASFRAQAGLFADPLPREQAAFDALLAALATPTPAPGSVRHFVERTSTRHNPAADPLRDPYHLPPYGGRPPELLLDNWVRLDQNGALETGTTEHDADGTVYGRQYLGPTATWYYDAPQSQAHRMRTDTLPLANRINQDQGIVLDLIARGGSRLLTLPDGTRVISHSQPLLETRFAQVLQSQQQDPNAGGAYLGDISADATITTLVRLGADGRARRIETWASRTSSAARSDTQAATGPSPTAAGLSPNSALLESWELVSEEQIPPDRVPPGTFDADPPGALNFWDALTQQPAPFAVEPTTITLTDALALARTPLFALAGAGQAGPPLVQIGAASDSQIDFGSSDVFEGALRRGLATRLTYWLQTDGSLQRLMYIYEGDAKAFGAYIRARSSFNGRWLSEPIQVTIGQRSLSGWRIAFVDGGAWTLIEVDGTLLAAETDDPVQQAALARLQRISPP